MRGLSGFVRFDDRLEDSPFLARTVEAPARGGQAGGPEFQALQEGRPFDDGRLVLAFDGRIDNREELPGATDSEKVLQAHRAWGERAPDRLMGDFAYAIWDRQERELFAARDFLGMRPFYYFWDGRSFLFSSEIATLLADDRVPRTLNEGMIAEYLSDRITSREETLYAAIRRLPPGHVLRVSAKGLRLTRWFSLDPREPLSYRRDEEFQAHARALLSDAVRTRMGSSTPVGAYLSGGVDSGSVAAVAASQGKISAYSIAFPGRDCDETALIEELRRKWDIPGEIVREPAPEFESYVRATERTRQFPGYPNGTVLSPLDRCARRDGVRVILTGMGGDEWFMGSPPPRPLDWLRRFRPRRRKLPPWIDPGFAARVSLSDRIERGPALGGLLSTFSSGHHVHVLEMQHLCQEREGVELRHPLSDRRIVEFALALPEDQRRRGSVRKFVLREAMRDYLPDSIRLGRSKADFTHLFAETLLLPEVEGRLEASAGLGRGRVDARKIGKEYQEMRRLYELKDPAYTTHVWPLWMALGLDLFLETAERRPAGTKKELLRGIYV
jgi:asparagine synthase (glutamine-hydrolysing)